MERYRVCFADTDAAGIVYHARYFEIAERGRNEALRKAHMSLRRILEDARSGISGSALVVHSATAKFHSPAFPDDLLDINNRIEKCNKARVVWTTSISRNDTPICNIAVELVSIDAASGAPAFLSDDLLDAIERISDLSLAQREHERR